jgi:hypothetical protein
VPSAFRRGARRSRDFGCIGQVYLVAAEGRSMTRSWQPESLVASTGPDGQDRPETCPAMPAAEMISAAFMVDRAGRGGDRRSFHRQGLDGSGWSFWVWPTTGGAGDCDHDSGHPWLRPQSGRPRILSQRRDFLRSAIQTFKKRERVYAYRTPTRAMPAPPEQIRGDPRTRRAHLDLVCGRSTAIARRGHPGPWSQTVKRQSSWRLHHL